MIAKKSLGQHFLRCRWVVSTLVESANISKNDVVLEIGPGEGILTRELAKHAQKVIAVEKDERLVTYNLKLETFPKNVEIIKGDILKIYKELGFKFQVSSPIVTPRLIAPKATKTRVVTDYYRASFKVISNIPYYLTSRLLRMLFKEKPRPKLIVLTIQKEVAERIAARPPKMNLLAISVQIFGKTEIIKTVPANCFFPKPKVDSAIIKISDISDSFFQNHKIKEEDFFKIVKVGFSQKRKQLKGNLKSMAQKEKLEQIFKDLNIKNTARAEELTLSEWANLTIEIGPQ